MAGIASNVPIGNWLLKSETAVFNGLEFFATQDKKHYRFDFMGGMEYSGFSDTTISIEAAIRHLFDYNSQLKEPPDNTKENEYEIAFMYKGDFLHDRLHVVFTITGFGIPWEDGSFQRFSTEYDITNDFSIMGGVLIFNSGDNVFFNEIGDNDRVFFECKYNF